MRNATSTNKDHAVGCVVCLDIALQVITFDALNVFLGSEDGSSEGLALKCGGMQVIEDDFFQLLVYFLLLT